MNTLYPLKFSPIYKDKIWGGRKIKNILGQNFGELPNCGESWAISGVEDNNTKVVNGFLAGNDLNEIVEIYMDDLVGTKAYDAYGDEFPILVKFLDANDWLSIQVHPNDQQAQKKGHRSGKTEMWYIIQADDGAELISGFKREVTPQEYQNHLDNGRLEEILNYEKVKEEDIFFIPAGRVHALGPGLLLAEIQQTSDVTYRIYDYDRIDTAGMKRELHTEDALKVIDFKAEEEYKTEYSREKNKTNEAVKCPYFETNVIDLTGILKKDFEDIDSCVIYTCVGGKADIVYDEGERLSIQAGEAIVIPNVINEINIDAADNVKLLETFIV